MSIADFQRISFSLHPLAQAKACARIFDKKKALAAEQLRRKKNLATTYSPTLLCAVPSAMKGLTSEFGMGSGISPSLVSPGKRLANESVTSVKSLA